MAERPVPAGGAAAGEIDALLLAELSVDDGSAAKRCLADQHSSQTISPTGRPWPVGPLCILLPETIDAAQADRAAG
jgi:hypothetical protein